MSPPPPTNGHMSFSSLGPQPAHPPATPGGDDSYSYTTEDRLYHEEAEAARQRAKRRTKRKSMKRDDNAPYRRGDDDYSEDSDDNPDPTVGVAARNGLRARNRATTTEFDDAQPFRPRNGKGRTTMSVVPEDEGIEDEGVGHDDFAQAEEDDFAAQQTDASPGPPRSPLHYQVLETSSNSLPQAFRQPRPIEQLLRDGKQRFRIGLAWLRKHPAVLIVAFAAVWLAYLLSGSSRREAAPSPVQRPLPDNFDELATRLGALESSHVGSRMWSNLDTRIARLEAEQSVQSDVRQQQASVLESNRRTKEQLGATIGRVDKLERRVESLEATVANALNDGSLREAVSKILPAVMPVRRAKNGGWDIDDSFFAVFMKRLLYGTGSLEHEIRHLVNQGVETESKRWSDDWQGDAKRLTERVEQMLASHTAEILISREDFVRLLEEKTEELWREIKSVQENTDQSPTAIKFKNSKGEDVTEMVQGIVDASLLRYSNDKLGMVDYALYSAGARVIEGTTSPTLQLTEEPGLFGRLWGKRAVHARPPHVALHPDTTVGQCWAFEGSIGDLGVLLSQPDVLVSSITIDHVAKALASDISSAPKDIEVWVTIEGEEDRTKARQYLENSPLRDELTSMPQTEENILVAKIVYDINSATPTQTFPVPKEFVDLGISTRITTFRVLSNWGGEVTCIYRVRVHGSTKHDSPIVSEQ
ncbi:hypothetical protein CC85DRAFT_303032 [Cutaneotrichosporon oleaginosum]|uniref:SUN domain-containing protein n=1 Tax=Cutaneotrichosporon oleaginosum TaxID=879819 RepID=A0A0J0XKV4_9TREE|nr:uncharacterized protein CC85DRAFT_303032 [Cutaneotrichosporon oleaginosum]KLT41710.1 hypothetical protein CC85DRAFT_303032 [Cutaneotrichosporon oleaginosum]TXT08082.1 hypothetical protein COLE_05006 [Cutaneotrichosporon oleaginosum]